MFDTFAFPFKALSVMKAIGLWRAWFFPRVTHVEETSVGVAQLHAVRIINAWLEFIIKVVATAIWNSKNQYRLSGVE